MIDPKVRTDREELLREASKFPLEFVPGGPFGVSDRLCVPTSGKGAEISEYSARLGDLTSREPVLPTVIEFLEGQIGEWLADLEKSPGNKYLLQNTGNAYLSRGKVDEAAECFQKALEADESFSSARASLAKARAMQDRLEEALELYLLILKDDPRDTSALMSLAHMYLRLGKPKEAREAFDRVLLFDQDNCAAHYNKGLLDLMEGKPERAVFEFRKAVSSDSRFLPGYNGLGVSYFILGHYRKAIKNLRIYLAIDRSDTAVVKNLATVYEESGEFEEATKLIEPYLVEYPSDWDARNIAAYSHFRLDSYERSFEHLRYLLQNADGMMITLDQRASLLNNMGVIECYLERYSVAERLFLDSIATVEDDVPVPYFNLAHMYYKRMDDKKAKRVMDKYLERAPTDTAALVLVAHHHYTRGEYSDAEQLLLRALEIDPTSRDAAVGFSSVYADLQEYDKAIQVLLQAIDSNPQDKTLVNNLAYAYLMKGLTDEAAEKLDEIAWDKNDFYAYATRGLLQIRRDEVDAGIEFYEQAAARAPAGEIRKVIRQKKNIELARYYLASGRIETAASYLRTAVGIHTKSRSNQREIDSLLAQMKW